MLQTFRDQFELFLFYRRVLKDISNVSLECDDVVHAATSALEHKHLLRLALLTSSRWRIYRAFFLCQLALVTDRHRNTWTLRVFALFYQLLVRRPIDIHAYRYLALLMHPI